MQASQAALPVIGGGTPLVHPKAASTVTPPLLLELPVVPLPLPLLVDPLPPDDPDVELPMPGEPELLPPITPEPLPPEDEELPVPVPPSPSPPVGAIAPPHATSETHAAKAAHREARIPVSVALEAASCRGPAPPGTTTS